MASIRPNSLATGSLDRLSDRRKDEVWVLEQWTDGSARVHLNWQGRLAVRGDRSASIAAPEAHVLVTDGGGPILLGVIDGVAHFALDVSHLAKPELENRLHEDAMLTGLREAAGLLQIDDANLLAFTSGITTWHAKHRFCGVCGSPTVMRAAGHERHCDSCGADHFPRTDPAVIMLVTDGDRCVLGRQKVWPPGMFSTLAGFLEPGESLEDTVAREVYEEVGLRVGDVRYSSSQPWPFPASVMLGFHATAVTKDLAVHPTELDDAQWFDREAITESRQLGRRGFPMIPPPMTIARRLIDEWLDA